MIDLDKLEELAKAATPGEWFWTEGLDKGEASLDVAGSDQFVLSATGLHSEGFLSVDEADAEFIAAANPAALLALIANHRAALARIAKVKALHASATIYELKAQYLPDESRPIHDYCVECTADSTISMIDDCEWDTDWPIVTYPCATVRALTEGENE